MTLSAPSNVFQQRFKIIIGTLIVLNVIGIVLMLTTGHGFFVIAMPLLLAALFVPLLLQTAAARPIVSLFAIISFLIVVGLILAPGFPIRVANINNVTLGYVTGALMTSLGGIGLLLAFVEFGVLRLLALNRLGAIARITYYEALLQPFTIIVIVGGIVSMGILARVSFFTYYEDFKMYRDIASSFVFLFTLPVMIFASTKVIDEEIENRTMLTLLSKPVSRTQVVLGKYLGVLMLVGVCVATLGIMAASYCYLRYYDDSLMDYRVASSMNTVNRLDFENYKAFMALLPALVLAFFQVATLAAISVAVSTRFGLAANVTTVLLIYIAANLAQYMSSTADLPVIAQGVIQAGKYLLPGLSVLDLNQRLVFGTYLLGKDEWLRGAPTYSLIWQYVGLSAVYTLFYVGAALSLGVALFRNRELL